MELPSVSMAGTSSSHPTLWVTGPPIRTPAALLLRHRLPPDVDDERLLRPGPDRGAKETTTSSPVRILTGWPLSSSRPFTFAPVVPIGEAPGPPQPVCKVTARRRAIRKTRDTRRETRVEGLQSRVSRLVSRVSCVFARMSVLGARRDD